MFGWFKKKKPEEHLVKWLDNYMDSMTLVIAVDSICHEYMKLIKNNQVKYPAYNRERENVLQTWKDTRIEALMHIFHFGKSSPEILALPQNQLEVLNCFLDQRPHLQMPQPQEDTLIDTIQGMWQAYVFLDKAGTAVGDSQTCRYTLKLKNDNIIRMLENDAIALRLHWKMHIESINSGEGSDPRVPRTLFQSFYEDITAKSKSIAFSAVFGPSYMDNIKHLEGEIKKTGGDVSKYKTTLDSLLAAKDPDQFT